MDTTESEHLPKMAAMPRPLCQSRPSVFRNRRDGRERRALPKAITSEKASTARTAFRARSIEALFTRSAKPCNYCNSALGPPSLLGPSGPPRPPRPAPSRSTASHARRGRRRAPWGSVSGRAAPAPRVGRRRRAAHSPARARTGPVGGAPRASPAARRAPSARLAVDAMHGVRGARSPRRATAARDGQASVPAGYGAPPNLRVISSISRLEPRPRGKHMALSSADGTIARVPPLLLLAHESLHTSMVQKLVSTHPEARGGSSSYINLTRMRRSRAA
jgi:hypothetical protein